MTGVLTLAVLDVAGGRVVAAGGGDRAAYPPLALPDGTQSPREIARRLVADPAADGLYVADLDSLGGGRPQACVAEVAAVADVVWVDGGYRTPEAVAVSPGRPVIASECWPDPASLMDAYVRRPDAVFSLDLRGGRLVASAAWPADPLAAASLAVNAGARTLLVLDVLSVGSGGCRTLPLCGQLAAMHPNVAVATGGGLRLGTPVPGVAASLIGGKLHRRAGLVASPAGGGR